MFARFKTWFHRVAFWLPFAGDLLLALPDEAERNAVRRHVWRQIFRSQRYWLLVAAQLIGTPLLLYAASRGLHLLDPSAHRKPALIILVSAAVIVGWGIATTWIGLGPLRPVIRGHAIAFLLQRGLRLCAACGYDLRTSCGRCPECGVVVDAGGTL